MREFMAITKALADPNRVRILLALRRRELCVCQITELFGFALGPCTFAYMAPMLAVTFKLAKTARSTARHCCWLTVSGIAP
jgi:hypothetical protein